MSTLLTIKNQIQDLINSANETTGNNDADLTNSVNALIEGYNVDSGGSGGNTSSPTEPYVVHTLDTNGNITGVALYGYTAIPSYAFYNYINLETVDFSGCPNLVSIGDYAFYGCAKLSLTSLPEGILSLGKSTFSGCSKLALTSLPTTIKTIGDRTFNTCTSLALSSLPENLTNIGQYAFYKCTNITNMILPESITSIGNYAFNGCTSMKNVEIKAQTLGAGTYIFYECTGLEKAWIRSTCTTITAAAAGTAPFVKCNGTLKIYAEPTSALSGWGTYFNRVGSGGSTTITVTYGQKTCPW